MQATRHTRTPLPPPVEITLTLTEDEARALRALCGSNNLSTCQKIMDGNSAFFPSHINSGVDLKDFMSKAYHALGTAVRP